MHHKPQMMWCGEQLVVFIKSFSEFAAKEINNGPKVIKLCVRTKIKNLCNLHYKVCLFVKMEMPYLNVTRHATTLATLLPHFYTILIETMQSRLFPIFFFILYFHPFSENKSVRTQ